MGKIVDGVAGVSLGVFLGLLVGLSISPTATIVVSALAAAIAGILAVDKSGRIGGSAPRMVGFGFSAVVALILGIYLRTHNSLSPTYAAEVADVRGLVKTDEEARQLILISHFGSLVPASAAESATSKKFSSEEPEKSNVSQAQKPNDRYTRTYLSAAGSSDCAILDPHNIKSDGLDNLLRVNAKGAWKDLAQSLDGLNGRDKLAAFDAAWRLACE